MKIESFEDLLARWNGGMVVGAQTRLAKALGCDQSTVNKWISGAALPHERVRPKLAKLLRLSVEELMRSLPAGALELRERPAAYGAPSRRRGPAFNDPQGHALVPVTAKVAEDRFVFRWDAPPLFMLPLAILTNGVPHAAVQVLGDFLDPFASPSDYVVISQWEGPEEGKVFLLRWDGACAFRRARRQGDHWDWLPEKPGLPKPKPEDLQIIGKAVYILRSPV